MIVVATTTCAWKAENPAGVLAWLENAEAMIQDARALGEQLTFFATLELDGRGTQPFGPMVTRMNEAVAGQMDAGADWWTYSIDDGAEEIDSGNRLVRICEGRNLIHEYAMRTGASHILFLDSDMRVPGDSISKLLAVNHPVVGGDAPQYGLHGPAVTVDDHGQELPFPVESHWNTAGFLLVRREVFKALRWRWSIDDGQTDDPAFQADQVALGFGQTWVRKDVVGINVTPLVPVEQRDEDRRVRR